MKGQTRVEDAPELVCDRIPFKEERFILAHNFRGFSLWLIGPVALGWWQQSTHGMSGWHKKPALAPGLFTAVWKQSERRGQGSNMPFQGHVPGDLTSFH
jgi:hypothetical protein